MEQILFEQVVPQGVGPGGGIAGEVTDVHIEIRTATGQTVVWDHKPAFAPKIGGESIIRLSHRYTTDSTPAEALDRHQKMVEAQLLVERKARRKHDLKVAQQIEQAYEGQEIPAKLQAVIDKAREGNDG